MQRSYEVMFIVRPDLLEEDIDKLIATLQGHATTAGATVQKTEKMGKRRLAYDVKKFSDGQYVLFVLQADGKADPRTGAAHARFRAGDQVHHRPNGRRAAAAGQGSQTARIAGEASAGRQCAGC